MVKKEKNKKKNEIDQIIKDIVFTKQQVSEKELLKDLFIMRYGDEWEKYYPQR